MAKSSRPIKTVADSASLMTMPFSRPLESAGDRLGDQAALEKEFVLAVDEPRPLRREDHGERQRDQPDYQKGRQSNDERRDGHARYIRLMKAQAMTNPTASTAARATNQSGRGVVIDSGGYIPR